MARFTARGSLKDVRKELETLRDLLDLLATECFRRGGVPGIDNPAIGPCEFVNARKVVGLTKGVGTEFCIGDTAPECFAWAAPYQSDDDFHRDEPFDLGASEVEAAGGYHLCGCPEGEYWPGDD